MISTREGPNSLVVTSLFAKKQWRIVLVVILKARIFDAMDASEAGGANVVQDAFRRIAAEHPQIGAAAE